MYICREQLVISKTHTVPRGRYNVYTYYGTVMYIRCCPHIADQSIAEIPREGMNFLHWNAGLSAVTTSSLYRISQKTECFISYISPHLTLNSRGDIPGYRHSLHKPQPHTLVWFFVDCVHVHVYVYILIVCTRVYAFSSTRLLLSTQDPTHMYTRPH